MTTLAGKDILAAKQNQRRVRAYDVVRWTLGLILLTAAALKAHQLATEPVANEVSPAVTVRSHRSPW